jgi:hypothetical protein
MKKALFICGSLNQTSMMHKISMFMHDWECYFTPYYADGLLRFLSDRGLLDFTIMGGNFFRSTLSYLLKENLKIDYRGYTEDYTVVFTCSDLVIPKNIRKSKIVLVQEGMTDPKTLLFSLVKYLRFPRWLASTAATGLSHAYDLFFVASEGYRSLFIGNGVDPEKIRVTGIPNFDYCRQYIDNKFPHTNYVLVATSDSRETFKLHNRRKFIERALAIANGRPLIFKLHPNEKINRATREIARYAPGSLVFSDGSVNEMIANCDVLITEYSSCVYVGIALGKEVYSAFDPETLRRMTPIQNNGTSAEKIAQEVNQFLFGNPALHRAGSRGKELSYFSPFPQPTTEIL